MRIIVGTVCELNIDTHQILSFYDKEWMRSTILSQSSFYRWQFCEVPNYEKIDNCCVAIDENNEIVGVMGVNSRDFFLKSRNLLGGELTTWVIKDEYRGKGIALKILNYLQEKYDVLIGMSISGDALAVYLRCGFHYLRGIPRYVKVVDWEKLEKYSEYTNLAKKIDKYWNRRIVENEYKLSRASEDRINEIANSFYKNSNMFSRNSGYLEWRYYKHPMFSYNTSIVSSSIDSDGVFIATRVEPIGRDLSILHIVDLFGEPNDIPAAIQYALDEARSQNISIIDFFCTNSTVNRFFIENGWFSTLDHDFFQVPHLFCPIELRKPATTSLIYWSKPEFTSFLDLGALYITKQDADFDRPSLLSGRNDGE